MEEDIRYIFESIQSIKRQLFDCTFRDLKFTEEKKKKGFYSTYCFTCTIYGLKENISNENPSDNVNINVHNAVINIGQELCSTRRIF